MTIIFGTENLPQIRANDYEGVSIKDNRRTPRFVNHDQTPIQKQMELLVTNGREYETLLEAVDKVNSNIQQDLKIFLWEVYDEGLVPLYFRGPKKDIFLGRRTNPCEETFLGQSYECLLPMPTRPLTLVEKLGTIVKIKWDEKCRKEGVFS